MLLKIDPTTKWYRLLQEAGAHFLTFNERLRYSELDKAGFPSVLAILSG